LLAGPPARARGDKPDARASAAILRMNDEQPEISMNTFVEAKGFRIPIVGLGTWALRGRDCARLVEQAIRIGYRHVDTAQMYDNEREVGEGVRASGKRSEVIVTTKVQPTSLAPHDLERSVKESIAHLRLDVIDLLLIHWPNPRVPLSETLGAMAKMKREGYVRQIGVSNFTVALLDEANKLSPEPLVCNQIECHPYLDQQTVIAACRRHGMAVVAYSPIARGSAKGDEVLERIGKAHGKSAAQVSLRFLVQQGIAVIPRTSKVERLQENFALFDFKLSDVEMAEIGRLSRRGGRIVDWSWSPNWD
jgi:2,5-diketo-D-gluconate reductase B